MALFGGKVSHDMYKRLIRRIKPSLDARDGLRITALLVKTAPSGSSAGSWPRIIDKMRRTHFLPMVKRQNPSNERRCQSTSKLL
jgi:hypothetical protein